MSRPRICDVLGRGRLATPSRFAPASVALLAIHVLLHFAAGSIGTASAAAAPQPRGSDAAAFADACEADLAVDIGVSLTLLQRSVRLRSGSPQDDVLATSQASGETSTIPPSAPTFSTSWRKRTRELFSPQGEEAWLKRANTWWHQDVFQMWKKKVEPNEELHNAATADEWLVFGCTVVVCFIIDYNVFRHFKDSLKNNLLAVIFWVLVAGGYNIYFALRYGRQDGVDWCMGYLLEWILSLDNMFVYLVVLRAYKTPDRLMHKALFFGILGAVFLKVVVFMALGTLVQVIPWLRIAFGFVLIYSGVHAVADNDEEDDLDSKLMVRAVKYIFGSRLQHAYDAEGTLFLVDSDGRHRVSLLFLVIICLELTDCVFAVDSTSAKVAQIPSQYIAYSSTVLALFGLRSMFFVIKDLLAYFELLKYGMCIILVFIGVELVASPLLHLETATVCIVILAVFLVSLTASTAKKLLTDKGSMNCGLSGFSSISSNSGWHGPRGPGANEAG